MELAFTLSLSSWKGDGPTGRWENPTSTTDFTDDTDKQRRVSHP